MHSGADQLTGSDYSLVDFNRAGRVVRRPHACCNAVLSVQAEDHVTQSLEAGLAWLPGASSHLVRCPSHPPHGGSLQRCGKRVPAVARACAAYTACLASRSGAPPACRLARAAARTAGHPVTDAGADAGRRAAAGDRVGAGHAERGGGGRVRGRAAAHHGLLRHH